MSWFDDTGRGECRLPKAWRVLYQDVAGAWCPVINPTAGTIRKTDPVTVSFTPVMATALRLEIDQADGFAAGLYEWQVEAAQ